MADNPQGMQMKEILVAMSTLMQQMSEGNRETFLDAIKELKKPTEVEQKKLDQEATKTARQAKERIDLATVEMNRIKYMEENCPHTTYHPGTGVERHLWRAQVHAPANQKPYFVPTCTACRTQLPRIQATPDMLTNGVNLDQYIRLDLDVLKSWAKKSWVEVA